MGLKYQDGSSDPLKINVLFSLGKQGWTHYEKYYTGNPKNGKDYRLFVKKLNSLRSEWEVHGLNNHLLDILPHSESM